MFRIITTSRANTAVFRGNKATGSFGSARAIHRTPRLYKKLDSAIWRARLTPGEHEIRNDENQNVAIVAHGKLLGVISK